MPAKSRANYAGDFKARRALMRSMITPSTRCWRCGRTLSEHPAHRDGKPPRWQAGHIDGGNGAIAPEASTCNLSAGASAGNHKRVDPQAKRWW